VKKYTFDMEVRFNYKIDRDKLFRLVAEFAKEYPDAVEAILNVVKQQKGKVGCPFPFDCSRFPCGPLTCNADTLDNGHAYRMS